MSEEQVANEFLGLNEEQLDEIVKERRIDLGVAIRARRVAQDALHAAELEVARRAEKRRLVQLEEDRRQAVLQGEALPAKPVTATLRASQSRLQTITLSRKPTPTPVGESKPAEPMPTPPPKYVITVSDHAVVRYMERVTGLDVQKIKDQILTPVVRRAIENGFTRVRVHEGVVVAKTGVITSFLPSEAGPARGPGRKVRAAWNAGSQGFIPNSHDWDDDQEAHDVR